MHISLLGASAPTFHGPLNLPAQLLRFALATSPSREASFMAKEKFSRHVSSMNSHFGLG